MNPTKTLLTLIVCLVPLSVSANDLSKVELLCREHNSDENHVIVMPLEDAKFAGLIASEDLKSCLVTDTANKDTLKRLISCHFEYEFGGNNYMREFAVNRKTGEMTSKYFETDTGRYEERKYDCEKVENKF